MLRIEFSGTSHEIAFKDLIDDVSKLVQIMAWCCPAFNQCLTISMLLYGMSRPQWVELINSLWPGDATWRHRKRSTLAQVMAFISKHLDDVKMPINKTRLKIAVLKWHLGLPGANELKAYITLYAEDTTEVGITVNSLRLSDAYMRQ